MRQSVDILSHSSLETSAIGNAAQLATQRCSALHGTGLQQLVEQTKQQRQSSGLHLAHKVDESHHQGAVGAVHANQEAVVHHAQACQQRCVRPQRLQQLLMLLPCHLHVKSK